MQCQTCSLCASYREVVDFIRAQLNRFDSEGEYIGICKACMDVKKSMETPYQMCTMFRMETGDIVFARNADIPCSYSSCMCFMDQNTSLCGMRRNKKKTALALAEWQRATTIEGGKCKLCTERSLPGMRA